MGTITIHQTPENESGGFTQSIRQTVYPVYSTWSYATTDTIYGDFKYHIDLVNEDGIKNTFISVAEDDNNWSKLSVANYMKNYLDNIFQPKAHTIKENENAIMNYQLHITPYNNGTTVDSDSATTKSLFAIKSSFEDLYNTDYFLNSTDSKMLVDIDTHTVDLDTYITNKAFYGSFGIGGSFVSQFDRVRYKITKPNGVIETYDLMNSLSAHTYSATTVLGNCDTMLVEIPAAPKNINNWWLMLAEITLPDGYIFYPNQYAQVNIEYGDKMCYAAYSGTTRVSKEYCLNIVQCKTRYTPMGISWLTQTGAYDTFVAYAKNEKDITVTNKTYVKNNYKRTDNNYYDDILYRGEDIYQQDINENYTLITDWLKPYEVEQLEELFTSPDVFIQLNGEHYPVISTVKKATINNPKNPKLFKHTITVRLSKQKYTL